MDEKEIIQIASATNHFGLKNDTKIKAKVRNKTCGDEITVEISEDLKNMRFETQSCIFTQASAAILTNHFQQIQKFGISKLLKLINKKIQGEKIELPIKIDELDFLVQNKHKMRKACIELPFNAAIKALDD